MRKSKLNGAVFLILKALIDSNFSHDQFFQWNNMPKEFDNIKKDIKMFNDKWKFKLCMKQYLLIVQGVAKIE